MFSLREPVCCFTCLLQRVALWSVHNLGALVLLPSTTSVRRADDPAHACTVQHNSTAPKERHTNP